jgi:hypothetical protein
MFDDAFRLEITRSTRTFDSLHSVPGGVVGGSVGVVNFVVVPVVVLVDVDVSPVPVVVGGIVVVGGETVVDVVVGGLVTLVVVPVVRVDDRRVVLRLVVDVGAALNTHRLGLH